MHIQETVTQEKTTIRVTTYKCPCMRKPRRRRTRIKIQRRVYRFINPDFYNAKS